MGCFASSAVMLTPSKFDLRCSLCYRLRGNQVNSTKAETCPSIQTRRSLPKAAAASASESLPDAQSPTSPPKPGSHGSPLMTLLVVILLVLLVLAVASRIL